MSIITDEIMEFVITGRLPYSDIYMSFEAFYSGLICTSWTILTYRFTATGFYKTAKLIESSTSTSLDGASEAQQIAL